MSCCCIPCSGKKSCCWKLSKCCTCCCCNPYHCCFRMLARRFCKSGAIEKMVEQLVPAILGGNPNYVHTFLSSYRALATTQRVLDLLFARYRCVLPHSSKDDKHEQLKKAMSTILDIWLDNCSEDFYQPPDFPCLKVMLAYVQLNMPGSALEHRVRLLLKEMEKRKPTETKTGSKAEKKEV